MVEHSLSTGRKLKPLMPRPMTTTTTPSLSHIHGNDFLSQYRYHHLGMFMFNLCVCVCVNCFLFPQQQQLFICIFCYFIFSKSYIYVCTKKLKSCLFLLGAVAEKNKREFNGATPVVVSSRWNPSPEQLRALEELYRRGTRTPSAEQIQHITAQLRRFGNIEGKNVFYWFQNHKARERQKRRRQKK